MIKGIHRQMIEVTHTGSPYFERAFLVVRNGQPPDEDKLHRMAEKVVEQAGTYAGLRRQKWRQTLQRVGFALLCAGGGATAMWAIQQLI